MGLYRARDAVNLPSLISWARVPLALSFPLVQGDPRWALAILVTAGISDVLDGYLARRFGWVTPMGAAIDPITDKVFVLTVVVTLIVVHALPLSSVILLSTREIGEAPLVACYALSRRMRRGRVRAPMANVTGKLATVAQFVTVLLAIVRSPFTTVMLWVTAIAGLLAAIHYALRAHDSFRRGHEPNAPAH